MAEELLDPQGKFTVQKPVQQPEASWLDTVQSPSYATMEDTDKQLLADFHRDYYRSTEGYHDMTDDNRREFEVELMDMGGILEGMPTRVGKGLVRGAVGTLAGIGGGVEALGRGIGVEGLEEAGASVAGFGERQISNWAPQVDATWVDDVASGFGSMFAFMVPGLGTEAGLVSLATKFPQLVKLAKVARVAIPTILEAATESGSTYRSMLENGASEEEALAATAKSFMMNTALIGVTNKFGILGDKRSLGGYATGAGLEGIQEMGQYAIGQDVEGNPINLEEMLYQGAIGSVVGGVTTATLGEVGKRLDARTLLEGGQGEGVVNPETGKIDPDSLPEQEAEGVEVDKETGEILEPTVTPTVEGEVQPEAIVEPITSPLTTQAEETLGVIEPIPEVQQALYEEASLVPLDTTDEGMASSEPLSPWVAESNGVVSQVATNAVNEEDIARINYHTLQLDREELFSKTYTPAEFEAILPRMEQVESLLETAPMATLVDNRKEVLQTIENTEIKPKVKEALRTIVNSIQGPLSIGLDIAKGNKSTYIPIVEKITVSPTDLPAFSHELGHFGFFNLLSATERVDFMRESSARFAHDKQAMATKLAIRPEGKMNTADNYVEYFAEMFMQYVHSDILTSQEHESLFKSVLKRLRAIYDSLRNKGLVDKKLIPYFEKLAKKADEVDVKSIMSEKSPELKAYKKKHKGEDLVGKEIDRQEREVQQTQARVERQIENPEEEVDFEPKPKRQSLTDYADELEADAVATEMMKAEFKLLKVREAKGIITTEEDGRLQELRQVTWERIIPSPKGVVSRGGHYVSGAIDGMVEFMDSIVGAVGSKAGFATNADGFSFFKNRQEGFSTKMQKAIAGTANWTRVPFWSKWHKRLAVELDEYIARVPHAHQVAMKEILEDNYTKQSAERKEKVGKVLLQEDLAGQVFNDFRLQGKGADNLGIDITVPGLTQETIVLDDVELKMHHAVRNMFKYAEKVGLDMYRDFMVRRIQKKDLVEWSKLTGVNYTEEQAQEVIDNKATGKNESILAEYGEYVRHKQELQVHREGYLPHMRRGNYILTIKNTKGNIVHSEGFEYKHEAEAVQAKYEGKPEQFFLLDLSEYSPAVRELMEIGRHLPAIKELIAKEVGLDKAEAAIAQIRAHTVGGRWTKSKAIAGYSLDVDQGMDDYINNFIPAMSKLMNRDRFGDIITETRQEIKDSGNKGLKTKGGLGISTELDQYSNYANSLVRYVYGQEDIESGANRALRSSMYIWFLSWKISFGALNYIGQRALMTAPWTAAQFVKGGDISTPVAIAKSTKVMAKAQWKELKLARLAAQNFMQGNGFMKWLPKVKWLTTEEKYVLEQMYRRGELKEMRQLEIADTTSRDVSKVMRTLDFVGFITERGNRIHAALTAVGMVDEMVKSGVRDKPSNKGLLREVEDFNNSTQVLYGKANRMKMARGPLAPVMMFKSYLFNYLNMSWNLMTTPETRGVFGMQLAMIVALGGIKAIPIWTDEVEEVVDVFGRMAMGDDWELSKREMASRIKDNHVAHAFTSGIPAEALGLDVSSMIGLGQLLSSPVVPMAQGLIRSVQNWNAPEMDLAEKTHRMWPRTADKIYRAYKMHELNTLADDQGKPFYSYEDALKVPMELRARALAIYARSPKHINFMQKVAFGMGFPASGINDYYKDVIAIRDRANSVRKQKGGYHRAMARALVRQDENEYLRLAEEMLGKGLQLNLASVKLHQRDYLILQSQGRENY